MSIIYDLLFLLFSLFYLPYMFIRGKFHRGLVQRLGFKLPAAGSGAPAIWFHAVSVGEAMAIEPLAKLMRQNFPHYRIVISTTTPTGQKIARRLTDSLENSQALYAPLDLSWVVRRFINAIQPKLFILAETELWPNLINELSSSSVEIALVNGRVSDRSFCGYRIFKFIFKSLLGKISLFLVQTKVDQDRLIQLGAPGSRVHIAGNLKFDVSPPEPKGTHPADEPILVCGSTHPGEEEILLKAYKELRGRFKDLVLLIAPRHPERGEEVSRLAVSFSWETARRSQGELAPSPGRVLILDVIGELAGWYDRARVIFVGGSLVPKGGHNIIEPASRGKPVVVGPHMENFREIAEIFLKREAVNQVKNETELTNALTNLLESPDARHALGERARQTVLANRGATSRTFTSLKSLA